MTITLDKLQREAVKSYTNSLTKTDLINAILDEISERKKIYKNLAKNINHIDDLLCKITWLYNLSDSDEVLIYSILAMANISDKKYRKFLNKEREFYDTKALFQDEFQILEEAIENHKESIEDVWQIMLVLRKDDEFQDLSAMLEIL